MYGTIAIVSADNLGSLALGGFKESCSSLKMCRHCMATKDESRHQVCTCMCCVCVLEVYNSNLSIVIHEPTHYVCVCLGEVVYSSTFTLYCHFSVP